MKTWILTAALLVTAPIAALAQAQLTAADIQRLQDNVFDAAADVSRLRQRDAHGVRRPARSHRSAPQPGSRRAGAGNHIFPQTGGR